MIIDQLKADLVQSLKRGDSVHVGTLRFLLAAIQNLAIRKYGNASDTSVTDEDVLDVIKKQTKTHRESIDAFEKAGRTELAAKEKAELVILEEFLPKQISDDDIKKILDPVLSSGEKDFGLLMKQAMTLVAGKADGGRVSTILKQLQKSQSDKSD